MIELFPDQAALKPKLRDAMRRHKAILLQAACGFGKTVVLADLAAAARMRSRRVIFSVHRKELIVQTARTFDKFGLDYSYVAAGRPYNPQSGLWIASIPTLRNRMEEAPDCDLLIIDECHLSASAGWSRVINHYRERGAYRLGCSASPLRLDGRGLGEHFDEMVCGPSVAELMAMGRLSDYRMFAPKTPDLSQLHLRGNDYRVEEAEELMSAPSITGDAISTWKQHAFNKRTLCFCVSRERSKATAAAFREAGIAALHIDGETHNDIRARALRDLADGALKVVTNVQLFTEGVDLAALAGREDVTVECIINLRPTQSIALWTQIIGRALRRKQEPAIILDHTGTWSKLGLPETPREWSLEGEIKIAKKAASKAKVCAKCFRTLGSHVRKCPAPCNYEFPVESREVEERDGELHELDRELELARQKTADRQEQGMATGREALIEIGRRKGYKSPERWADHVLAGRQAKREKRA